MTSTIEILDADKALAVAAVCHRLKGTPVVDSLECIINGKTQCIKTPTTEDVFKVFVNFPMLNANSIDDIIDILQLFGVKVVKNESTGT